MPYVANASGTGSYFYPAMGRYSSKVDRGSLVQSLSSTFTTGSIGSNPAIVLGPVDVGKYSNYTITMINNSVNNLISGSVQISPNGTNWITMYSANFVNLTSSGMASASFTSRSDKYVRAVAYPSGSGGAVTGSIDCYITAN
jgi:hypothetical protein